MDTLINSFKNMCFDDVSLLCNSLKEITITEDDGINSLCDKIENLTVTPTVKKSLKDTVENNCEEFKQLVNEPFISNRLLFTWQFLQVDLYSPHRNFLPQWQESF